jgi:23S rRNA U2552 (ribose-2'-O)-methylase RlmE/FtsJ
MVTRFLRAPSQLKMSTMTGKILLSRFYSCCTSQSSFSSWHAIVHREGHLGVPRITKNSRHFNTTPGLLKHSAGGSSSSAWFRRQASDPYIKSARLDGYRCRSAYKLIQINDKLGRKLLYPGIVVVDLGCAPGSWCQVASKLINSGGFYDDHQPDGFLIGCDLLNLEPVPGTIILPKRDFTDENGTQREIQVIYKKKVQSRSRPWNASSFFSCRKFLMDVQSMLCLVIWLPMPQGIEVPIMSELSGWLLKCLNSRKKMDKLAQV